MRAWGWTGFQILASALTLLLCVIAIAISAAHGPPNEQLDSFYYEFHRTAASVQFVFFAGTLILALALVLNFLFHLLRKCWRQAFLSLGLVFATVFLMFVTIVAVSLLDGAPFIYAT